jgi:hypothetical protein
MDEKFVDFLKREKELTEKLLMLSNRLREALMSQRQDLVENKPRSAHNNCKVERDGRKKIEIHGIEVIYQ